MPSGSVRSSMSSATRPSSLPETAALLAPQRATLASWGWLSRLLAAALRIRHELLSRPGPSGREAAVRPEG